MSDTLPEHLRNLPIGFISHPLSQGLSSGFLETEETLEIDRDSVGLRDLERIEENVGVLSEMSYRYDGVEVLEASHLLKFSKVLGSKSKRSLTRLRTVLKRFEDSESIPMKSIKLICRLSRKIREGIELQSSVDPTVVDRMLLLDSLDGLKGALDIMASRGLRRSPYYKNILTRYLALQSISSAFGTDPPQGSKLSFVSRRLQNVRQTSKSEEERANKLKKEREKLVEIAAIDLL